MKRGKEIVMLVQADDATAAFRKACLITQRKGIGVEPTQTTGSYWVTLEV